MNNRIEKVVLLRASPFKVWQALTNYQEFGEWFGVILEKPFVPGEISFGQITYPGYEHVKLEMTVQKMEVPILFSFMWHPFAIETDKDYSAEIPTLVEFRLEKIEEGTLLSVTESGFEKIPEERRIEAFRMNDSGWTEQMENIKNYIEMS